VATVTFSPGRKPAPETVKVGDSSGSMSSQTAGFQGQASSGDTAIEAGPVSLGGASPQVASVAWKNSPCAMVRVGAPFQMSASVAFSS
jgi:hypothetical protein